MWETVDSICGLWITTANTRTWPHFTDEDTEQANTTEKSIDLQPVQSITSKICEPAL